MIDKTYENNIIERIFPDEADSISADEILSSFMNSGMSLARVRMAECFLTVSRSNFVIILEADSFKISFYTPINFLVFQVPHFLTYTEEITFPHGRITVPQWNIRFMTNVSS
jgi:hypothetical protein